MANKSLKDTNAINTTSADRIHDSVTKGSTLTKLRMHIVQLLGHGDQFGTIKKQK